MPDPFRRAALASGLHHEMNNTEAALARRQGGTLVGGRCNPYGAESGGPRHVLGGLSGPGSARTEGMHLPEAVAQGEWACSNRAEVRCRMYCRCGHKGQVMELCSWHDETVFSAEFVAGTTRQVSKTVRTRGHFEEIQRRQSALCPACAYPPPFAELAKEVQGWQAVLGQYWAAGPRAWLTPGAQSLRTRIDDAGKLMDQAIKAGIIHQCPLTLRAVR